MARKLADIVHNADAAMLEDCEGVTEEMRVYSRAKYAKAKTIIEE